MWGLSWQLLANVVRFVAKFGIGIALARLLPPEDFGIIALAYIATGFAQTLADLGLGPALVQKQEITDRHVRVCHTVSLALGGVMSGVLFVGAGAVAAFFDDGRVEPVLQVLALTFLLSGFSVTSRALLTRRLRFDVTVKIDLLASIVGYGGVAVVMAAGGYGYWSLVGGTLSQAILTASLTYAASRHPSRLLIGVAELRDLLGFGVGISLTGIANYFARQGDYFVIGRIMTAASLGIYSRAYMLMELPLTFVGLAVSRVLFPAASRVQDDPERFRRAFVAILSLSLVVAVPLSLFMTVLAPEIVLTFYGETWAATIPLLQILALFSALRMSFNPAEAFLQARGHTFMLFACHLVYGVLVIGGSWWAGVEGGLEAVAWAVGGAISVMWVLTISLASKVAAVPVGMLGRMLLQSAAPGLAIGAVLFGLVYVLRALGAPGLVVLLVAACAFVAATGWSVLAQIRRLDHPAMNAQVANAIAWVMKYGSSSPYTRN